MERAATPQVQRQLALPAGALSRLLRRLRPRRLLYETALENERWPICATRRGAGADGAWTRPRRCWIAAADAAGRADWRARVFELAEALFQSIRMQLSVARYKAIAVDRGANLDTIDLPLNNRGWLKARFAEIRATADEAGTSAGHRRDRELDRSGAGRLLRRSGRLAAAAAPGARGGLSSRSGIPPNRPRGFARGAPDEAGVCRGSRTRNRSSTAAAHALYGPGPEGGLSGARVYGGDARRVPMRLVCNGSVEIRFIEKPAPVAPVEFDIPRGATRDRDADARMDATGGAGRQRTRRAGGGSVADPRDAEMRRGGEERGATGGTWSACCGPSPSSTMRTGRRSFRCFRCSKNRWV